MQNILILFFSKGLKHKPYGLAIMNYRFEKIKKEVISMSYQKPQVLAESPKNIPYEMKCPPNFFNPVGCKF